ncbi:MAG TPA: TadA family conjugal transfer-associated ATPase [Pseudonocardiaceae bacterium]
MSTLSVLSDDARRRVRQRLVDAGGPVTATAVAAAVRAESGGVVADHELLGAIRELGDELGGTGPLQPLLTDPAVTDVLVNGPDDVWVDRGRGLQRVAVRFPDGDAVRRLAQRLAVAAGRRLDEAVPFVDARLPDGTRLHAALPPVAADGVYLSLRVHRPAAHGLAALRALGTVSEEMEAVLRAIVAARLAFLVVGGTGSGKTTLLGALLGCVDPAERLVCVEDAGELHPAHPHLVRLVTRPPNIEGVGEVTLRDLVRQALRMRPDRIVVGEVRGAEVCELLTSLNTGHEGGAGTLHANSVHEVPARLEALAALGGLGRLALHSQLAAALHVIVEIARHPGGRREVTAIGVLDRSRELVRVTPAWRAAIGWTSGRDALAALLRARGQELPAPAWASC